MEKSEFENLLWRYRAGLCSEDEIRRINLWLSELNETSAPEISEDEKAELKIRLKHSIDTKLAEATGLPRPVRRLGAAAGYLTRAAIVLIFLSAGFYFFLSTEKKGRESTSWISSWENRIRHGSWHAVTRENKGESPMNILLPDHSKITLLPGSSITYRDPFEDQSREVTLQGNAFFEITRDVSHPFFVYHGNLVTQVLGTSFWIKSNEALRTQEVEVVTGSVRLREKKIIRGNKEGIILKPSQKATYFEERGDLLQPSPAKKPLNENERPDHLLTINFQNETLAHIRTVLEGEYGAEIVLANPKLQFCTFTGDVSNLTLGEALGVICKSIQSVDYDIIGNQYVLYGKSCD
ncbi:hypothetical protein GCM10023091_26490 [Ravibacter arvi]|uniref:FecR family protein n=1 Tax=Ravibacter arvi TaxID=2051041 RepID=A0ABP8M211_9BACT